MIELFRRSPVFCTIYLLVVGGLLAGLASQLGDALMGAYPSVDPHRPQGHVPITYKPGLVESVVGMAKFFADGGNLDSTLFSGSSWPSILRQLFGLTTGVAACLMIPLLVGRRIASLAIGVGGVVVLSLFIYLVMALGVAHGSPRGDAFIGVLFLLTMLFVPLFAVSCVVFAISEFSTSRNPMEQGQRSGSKSAGEDDA